MHFCCTQFDFSVFDNTTKPIPAKGKRSKKYPAVKPSYESASIPGLSFGKLNCLHTTDCGSSQRDYNPPLPYFLEGHAPPPWTSSPLFYPHPDSKEPTEFNDPHHFPLHIILCQYFNSNPVTRIKKPIILHDFWLKCSTKFSSLT